MKIIKHFIFSVLSYVDIHIEITRLTTIINIYSALDVLLLNFVSLILFHVF